MKKFSLFAALIPFCVNGATLDEVSMQGTMLMPMISYQADVGRLQVMMPAGTAQLTPLMVSHAEDQFDPADPWFENLDPAAQGFSFSRRYGFVMGMSSDPLPPDTEMWIRKLSGPEALAFYRYSRNPPKAWDPIFGTSGAPAARPWNGMMFHPGVSAPAGEQGYSATFEVYLVDTNTGNEIAHSGTGPIVLDFTNVPDGRPSLEIHWMPAVSWPEEAVGWIVEYATSPHAAAWTAMTNTPTLVEGRPTLLMESLPDDLFLRMRRLP